MVRDLLISTSYFLHLWLFQCPRKIKQRLCKSELPFFFHVEQVFPQCRGLISCLGTPQIASTDRYWVYPSAFSNRALNHPMVKCARKKLKQEPDPIHQSNQWKTLSIFTWLEGPKKWKKKFRQDPSQKETSKCRVQVWLSSLSPCCLKPGDRGCLGPEVLADRRSR